MFRNGYVYNLTESNMPQGVIVSTLNVFFKGEREKKIKRKQQQNVIMIYDHFRVSSMISGSYLLLLTLRTSLSIPVPDIVQYSKYLNMNKSIHEEESGSKCHHSVLRCSDNRPPHLNDLQQEKYIFYVIYVTIISWQRICCIDYFQKLGQWKNSVLKNCQLISKKKRVLTLIISYHISLAESSHKTKINNQM